MNYTSKSELKVGRYYTIDYVEKEGRGTFVTYYEYLSVDKDRVDGPLLGLFDTDFRKRSSAWVSGRVIRDSTPEEINWLKQCVEKGHYIPKPEYIESYEIY